MAETRELPTEVRTVHRDAVVVDGTDAATWLQGQLSQDVEALAVGDTRFALLLTPQGKAVCLCRGTRESPERFVVDTDAGAGQALYDRLKMFKLRVKATLEAVSVEVEELLGGGWDALGPPVVVADSANSAAARGPASVSGGSGGGGTGGDGTADDPFEYERILASVPRTGAEITESTIPQEAGGELIARAVSFTKGCYTGQELVARVDSRGSNVPRRLRLLVGEPGDPAGMVGSAVLDGDRDVGTVTSSAVAEGRPPVALAYLKRSAGDDALLVLTTPAGLRPVRAFEPGSAPLSLSGEPHSLEADKR